MDTRHTTFLAGGGGVSAAMGRHFSVPSVRLLSAATIPWMMEMDVIVCDDQV
jgi:hypothetical protein